MEICDFCAFERRKEKILWRGEKMKQLLKKKKKRFRSVKRERETRARFFRLIIMCKEDEEVRDGFCEIDDGPLTATNLIFSAFRSRSRRRERES